MIVLIHGKNHFRLETRKDVLEEIFRCIGRRLSPGMIIPGTCKLLGHDLNVGSRCLFMG
jgi:hypothetical protein